MSKAGRVDGNGAGDSWCLHNMPDDQAGQKCQHDKAYAYCSAAIKVTQYIMVYQYDSHMATTKARN